MQADHSVFHPLCLIPPGDTTLLSRYLWPQQSTVLNDIFFFLKKALLKLPHFSMPSQSPQLGFFFGIFPAEAASRSNLLLTPCFSIEHGVA